MKTTTLLSCTSPVRERSFTFHAWAIAALLFLAGTIQVHAQMQTSVPFLTGFIQTNTTPCPPQSYVVTGTSISSDVVITAPTGFEISEDQITWVAPPASITIGQNGPTTIPPTTIYVRLNTSILGTYTGSILHFSTDSPSLLLPVDGVRSAKSPSTTDLLSTPNPSIFGQTVTLTASVTSPLPGVPTGTVSFYDGVTLLGTSAVNISASASMNTSTLAFGPHDLTATYNGDGNFDASTSSLVSQLVRGTTTTVVVSNNNPSILGQPVILTATVSSAFPGTPTGSVTFYDGISSLGSAVVSGGVGSFSTSALTFGSHSITAVYGGDVFFDVSTSSPYSQTVRASTTTGLVSNHNPSVSGQPVTLTASISSTTPGVIGGTVSFFDGGIGMGVPVAVAGGIATYTAAYVASSSPHTFSAVFNGDAGYAGSTSPLVNQVINKAATLPVITADHNPSYIGQPVTFSATVGAVSPGGGTPTGTVNFSIDGTPTGPVALTAGVASYTTSALTFGGHVINASYSGDAEYNPGVAAAYADTVGPTITATAGLHGSISPSGIVAVAYGSYPVFTITPDLGYRLDSLFIDGVSQPAAPMYMFENVITNHTIHATFAVGQFTLTAVAGPHGSIAPPGAVIVTFDSSQTFSFIPDIGYHVDSIIVDGVYAGDSLSYTFGHVSDNHTIAVSFAINTYPLSVSTAGNGTIAKNPEQPLYDHGTNVQVTATAAVGHLFDGWSGDASGTANPLTVAMDAAKNITATFVVDPVYLTRFRTASMVDWATSTDAKGKPALVKCKPDKVEFRFTLLVPSTATGVKIKIGMVSTGVVTRGLNQIASWSSAKEFSVAGIAEGEILVVTGWGTKGKSIKAQLEWATTPKVTKAKIALYDMNQPRLPMPNLVNVLSELGSWPTIGNPAGASSVIHPKYKDVQKSLNKKGLLHTGPASCLAAFTNGKLISKQQKALPPDKLNNKLYAEVLTLALNLSASAKGEFPAGLGELIYDNPSDTNGTERNGWTLNAILADANTVLGCGGSVTPQRYYDIISLINGAFRDGTIDTASWSCAGVKLTGVKALIDVPFLRAPAGFTVPKAEPAAVINVEPDRFSLNQNYPNPFNPATVISFSLPVSGYVTLKVYNMLGQEVATLLSNVATDEGEDEVEFDGTNLPSGVYFYRMTINAVDDEGAPSGESVTQVRKMILAK